MSSTPIDARILDEAAHWLTQLHATTVTDADRAARERWRQQSPEHARAWERAEGILNKLGSVPAKLAIRTLESATLEPAAESPARRAALTKALTIAAIVPTAWGAWRLASRQQWTADHRTAVGER